MSAYDKYLQLFNTGFEVGANGFTLRVAELVVYLLFACDPSRCLYPEKLWDLSLRVDDDQRTIG